MHKAPLLTPNTSALVSIKAAYRLRQARWRCARCLGRGPCLVRVRVRFRVRVRGRVRGRVRVRVRGQGKGSTAGHAGKSRLRREASPGERKTYS